MIFGNCLDMDLVTITSKLDVQKVIVNKWHVELISYPFF